MILGYCSNIFPGDGMQEHLESIESGLGPVRNTFRDYFQVGFYMSRKFAEEAYRDAKVFDHWLDRWNTPLYTVNAFPLGRFHDRVVKQQVYKPDWLSRERVDYTKSVIRVLSGVRNTTPEVSVSTVPLTYGKTLDWHILVDHLAEVIEECRRTEDLSGKRIAIAFEPEPDCYLQNSLDVKSFFSKLYNEPRMREKLGVDWHQAIRRYLGICYDACHFAVEFEPVEQTLHNLRDVSIFKMQISSALTFKGSALMASQSLSSFVEKRYLHQTRVLRENRQDFTRFTDLDHALESSQSLDEGEREYRVHFHVPVHRASYGRGLQGSQSHLIDALRKIPKVLEFGHYEVETYTFDVLLAMGELGEVISQNILKELQWSQQQLLKSSISG